MSIRRNRVSTAIDLDRLDTFIFDLDGVITRTASVHAAAWKRLFDELFERRAAGGPWTPFDTDREYRLYVDGKPRRDGLRSVLAARGISVPEGTPGDGPDAETVYGLAARKNSYVRARLARFGVDVFPDALFFIHAVRARRCKTAVVTASENSIHVLAAAGMLELFDERVDGTDIARDHLRGKPAPDSFLEAARRLGSHRHRCIVFEDAIAGVQAGRAGDFGLVVGVDRVGDPDALRQNGADLVISSFDEIELVRRGAQLELR